MRIAIAVILAWFAIASAEDETAHKLGPESKRPPRARIANALARHLHKDAIAKRLLTPETCKVTKASAQLIVLWCHERGCGAACQAYEASAELRFRPKGVTSIHKLTVTRHGETGECGHCMGTD